jgi:hypothetical protein
MIDEHKNPEKLSDVIDRLLDSSLFNEDNDKITINGVDFVCTCSMCPEQYDVFFHDQYVAYVRKRYGQLRAHPVINGEIQWDNVFYQEDEDDEYGGTIDNREETLEKIAHEIKKHILLPK